MEFKNQIKNFEKPEYFVNRELSWLKFDERVLSEAMDKNLPLFERLKFLSITASNLDEFFMVRVASLKDQVHAGYAKTDIAGLNSKEQLKEISIQTHALVQQQYETLNKSLLPALQKAGMQLIMDHESLTPKQQAYVDRYFEDNVYPVLTPMAMDSSRPFPLIRNKTLNIGALTYGEVTINATAQAASDLLTEGWTFAFNVTTTPLAQALKAIVTWTEDGFATYFETEEA